MKSILKSVLVITGMVVMTTGLNAQDKKMKIIIKENKNGQETVTESDELTPEIKEKLKNDGISVEELESGKAGEHKKIIINKEIEGEEGDGKAEKVIIQSGDMNDPELKKMMEENNVKMTTEDGQTKVIVDGKEVTSADSKDHKHKIVKVVIKKIELTEPNSAEYKKAGIQEPKEKLEVQNMNASPNPSNGKFRVSFSSPDKANVNLTVRNIEGKEVYNELISNFNGNYDKEIDLNTSNKGIYFVTLTQGKKSTMKKLIVD